MTRQEFVALALRAIAAIGVVGLIAIAIGVVGAQVQLFFYRRDQRRSR